jgi:hypothetical protein
MDEAEDQGSGQGTIYKDTVVAYDGEVTYNITCAARRWTFGAYLFHLHLQRRPSRLENNRLRDILELVPKDDIGDSCTDGVG